MPIPVKSEMCRKTIFLGEISYCSVTNFPVTHQYQARSLSVSARSCIDNLNNMN